MLGGGTLVLVVGLYFVVVIVAGVQVGQLGQLVDGNVDAVKLVRGDEVEEQGGQVVAEL